MNTNEFQNSTRWAAAMGMFYIYKYIHDDVVILLFTVMCAYVVNKKLFFSYSFDDSTWACSFIIYILGVFARCLFLYSLVFVLCIKKNIYSHSEQLAALGCARNHHLPSPPSQLLSRKLTLCYCFYQDSEKEILRISLPCSGSYITRL